MRSLVFLLLVASSTMQTMRTSRREEAATQLQLALDPRCVVFPAIRSYKLVQESNFLLSIYLWYNTLTKSHLGGKGVFDS